MTLQERGRKMYQKGYRYCIVFDASSNIEPLFVKALDQIGPLMRRDFPNEKNWRGFEINANGEELVLPELKQCDFGHETREEVRLLPWQKNAEHGGNSILCQDHYYAEMIERRRRAKETNTEAFCPSWDSLKVYEGS